jgi:hypothetical protein
VIAFPVPAFLSSKVPVLVPFTSVSVSPEIIPIIEAPDISVEAVLFPSYTLSAVTPVVVTPLAVILPVVIEV